MRISQMHSQLTELGNEYERLSTITVQLQSILQQIENSQDHLTRLRYNIQNQIATFSKIVPVKEDKI